MCIPGGDAVSKKISQTLGVEFQDTVEEVAVIHCCGDCEHAVKKADYSGIQTCSGAKMLYGFDPLFLLRLDFSQNEIWNIDQLFRILFRLPEKKFG